MIKKGIILAGGLGTRMSPLTKAVNKQLLPLYDKPLIFYPLSVLMLAGIKKIHPVKNPSLYGVASLDKNKKVTKLIEKPKQTNSNFAVTGLYFFDNKVIKFTKKLKPSKRGELEIIDLLNCYKRKNKLKAELIGRGGSWLDTGNINDFYDASNFISTIENRQGLKIACLEEIAFKKGWIKKPNIMKAIRFYGNCNYSSYLKNLI